MKMSLAGLLSLLDALSDNLLGLFDVQAVQVNGVAINP